MDHINHLNRDKRLKKIVALQRPFTLEQRSNVCLRLCNSIMSQQLSTRVAEVFHGRFLDLFKGKEPTPRQIASIPVETLRGIGLSNAKANYVLNVSRFFIEEKITDAMLASMGNEEIIKYLSRIKGVGQWTVEMILMFTLGREDVFALDDLGIQQAICKLYNIDASDKKHLRARMIAISSKWSPYRTYACRYLWGWKDNTPKTKQPAAPVKPTIKK